MWTHSGKILVGSASFGVVGCRILPNSAAFCGNSAEAGVLIDLLMDRFRGAVFHHGGGA